MTQAEKEMRESLLLADLWSNLRRIQIELENRIVPTLMEFDGDPDGKLAEKLNAATEGIEEFLLSNKLQARPSTKSPDQK